MARDRRLDRLTRAELVARVTELVARVTELEGQLEQSVSYGEVMYGKVLQYRARNRVLLNVLAKAVRDTDTE